MPRLLRKHTVGDESRIDWEPPQDHPRNVIIFGESGVGKSSLINLLAEKKVSETSSGALGCTLEYKQHSLSLGDQQFTVWDTAGLDEGTQGAVPAEKAEAYLRQLLHELAKNNGVDLLVYCVRGTRIRSALLTNYHIFYSAICRKKVPIAIVVTGLENQEGNMETWWFRNGAQFSSFHMHFDNHACVTTLESSVENTVLLERREVSRTALIKMITSTCRSQRWRPAERSWIDSAYSDIRAMLSPRDGSGARVSTIIMCDASRDCPSRRIRKRSISFQSPVAFSLSSKPLSFRSPVSISNDKSECKLPFEDGLKCTPERLYRVYQVPRKRTSPVGTDEGTKKVTVVRRGADLLIFCFKMEDQESRAVKYQWEHFNITYGGELSPQIIVVVGAANQDSAEEWWKDVAGGTVAKNDAVVAYWPPKEAGAEVDAARTQLRCLINDRCIDCSSKVTLARNEKLFRRPPRLDMSSLSTLWESYSRDDVVHSPEQDVLTNWGVWHQVQERSPMTTSTLVSSGESFGQP